MSPGHGDGRLRFGVDTLEGDSRMSPGAGDIDRRVNSFPPCTSGRGIDLRTDLPRGD